MVSSMRPTINDRARLMYTREFFTRKAFITKATVETFDEAVLPSVLIVVFSRGCFFLFRFGRFAEEFSHFLVEGQAFLVFLEGIQ